MPPSRSRSGIPLFVCLTLLPGCRLGFPPDDEGSPGPGDADAALDAGADVLPDVGGGDDVTEPDPCAPLAPTPECVPPTVSAACSDGWCRVPKGCFVAGSPPCEFGRGGAAETQVQVMLTHDFEVQQTEMTVAAWTALGFQVPTGSTCVDPACPVANVSWLDAVFAANQLSALHAPPLPACYAVSDCSGAPGEGTLTCASVASTTEDVHECLGYRIPTEIEWEYAARAGTTTAFYSGPITENAGCGPDTNLENIGWYCHNAAGALRHVGLKQANGFGLFDMSGNALEWTTGVFDSAGYGLGPLVDPQRTLPATLSAQIVLRGGASDSFAFQARSGRRSLTAGGLTRLPTSGIRLVRTLP